MAHRPSAGQRPSRPQWHFSESCDLEQLGAIYGKCLDLHHLLNRFVPWRRARVWSRIVHALAAA
jgi:hypothetical protein